eukprot:360680-Pleurochrysis_carterae.AAC.1
MSGSTSVMRTRYAPERSQPTEMPLGKGPLAPSACVMKEESSRRREHAYTRKGKHVQARSARRMLAVMVRAVASKH